MILKILSNKFQSLLLFFVNIFRRALCCLSRRRRSSEDTVALTHVVSNSDDPSEDSVQNWGEWEASNEPKTVQDHIELYRQQIATKNDQITVENEAELNFFEDMTPKITKQTKVLIDHGRNTESSAVNRLNCVEDSVSIIPSSELGEWDENSGWEGDSLDAEATRVLREKKRQEREKKAWEYYQKRLEKTNKALGFRVNT